MLTVYYIAATWLQSWRINSILHKIKLVHQRNGSVVIQQELPPLVFKSPAIKQKLEVKSIFSQQCVNKKSGNVGDLLWYSASKRIASIFPKQILDISGWISVIPGRTHLPIQITGLKRESSSDDKIYLLIEADYNTCQYRNHSSILELEKFGEALAWHASEYISLLVESDEQLFASLAVTFVQNNFTLENGIQIMRIQSVEIVGTPYRILNIGSVPETYAPLRSSLNRHQRKEGFMSRWRAHISMLCTFCEAVAQVKATAQEISVRHPGSGVGAVKLVPGSGGERTEEKDTEAKTSNNSAQTYSTKEITVSTPQLSESSASAATSSTTVFSPTSCLPPSDVSASTTTAPSTRCLKGWGSPCSRTQPVLCSAQSRDPEVGELPVLPETAGPSSRPPAAAAVVGSGETTNERPRQTPPLIHDRSNNSSVDDVDVDGNLGKLETDETRPLNTVQLQRLVLLEQLQVLRLKKDKLIRTRSSDSNTTTYKPILAGDSMTSISNSSLRSLPVTPRRTITTSSREDRVKPPNIVVFSDSASAAESVKVALETTLARDRYTIHILNFSQMWSTPWVGHACLLIVHGDVPPSSVDGLLNFVIHGGGGTAGDGAGGGAAGGDGAGGGSLLCLCSDFLGSVLHMFHTAEVRPNELVQCSYKSWTHVPLVHHVFCYQPSPSTPQFSHDEQMCLSAIPESVELKDKYGKLHKMKVEVLGAEETWQTPSLLLVGTSTSRMVFSQVHLEIDPGGFESEAFNRDALERSNKARLEILADVLGKVLGLQTDTAHKEIDYTPAYFLGNYEPKQELLDRLKHEGLVDGSLSLKAGNLTLKFCGKGVSPPPACSSFLPVLMYACPETFSTFHYFENLKTESIGRLVIFSDVLTTSMDIVTNVVFRHGFTVIPYYQTKGKGRSGNSWLSPKGCAMFSVQLHIPLQSNLGRHLSLVQHVVSLAIVLSICQQSGLEALDIGLKWPNDIYANKKHKIGGVLVTSIVNSDTVICNVGCALNLKNEEPTVCINDLVDRINKQTSSKIPPLSYEKYFAQVFNKIEELLNMVDSGALDTFLSVYYTYWLHSEAQVEVKLADSSVKKAKVKGIDSCGYLLVALTEGTGEGPGPELTVHPDGNSFDMMAGLIVPKQTS